MSKMSEIAMELDDQAVELGFESYEEAIAKGYDVCYGEEGAYLYKPQPEDEQLEAHKAWLKDRDELVEQIDACLNLERKGWGNITKTLEQAKEFIRGVKSE